MNGRFAPTGVIPACAQKIGCNQLKTVTEASGSIPDVGARDVCFMVQIGRATRARHGGKHPRRRPSRPAAVHYSNSTLLWDMLGCRKLVARNR
jgi:hypothetical protein